VANVRRAHAAPVQHLFPEGLQASQLVEEWLRDQPVIGDGYIPGDDAAVRDDVPGIAHDQLVAESRLSSTPGFAEEAQDIVPFILVRASSVAGFSIPKIDNLEIRNIHYREILRAKITPGITIIRHLTIAACLLIGFNNEPRFWY